jgi:hypothetical protein
MTTENEVTTACDIVVLAEKCHPPRDLPVSPSSPKGILMQGGGSSNACAFSASTGIGCRVNVSINLFC